MGIWGAPKLISPTFRGITTDRPMRYLHELNQHREALGQRYNFRILIEQSLSGLAKEWWTIVGQSIEMWKDFTLQSRRRFWNDKVQYTIRKILDFGYHNIASKQKRLTYVLLCPRVR